MILKPTDVHVYNEYSERERSVRIPSSPPTPPRGTTLRKGPGINHWETRRNSARSRTSRTNREQVASTTRTAGVSACPGVETRSAFSQITCPPFELNPLRKDARPRPRRAHDPDLLYYYQMKEWFPRPKIDTETSLVHHRGWRREEGTCHSIPYLLYPTDRDSPNVLFCLRRRDAQPTIIRVTVPRPVRSVGNSIGLFAVVALYFQATCWRGYSGAFFG